MPFLDWHFDCIVAISTIEFIDGLDAACNEIDRVLKQDGCFLVVTPTNSPIADAGLKLLTGSSAVKVAFVNRVLNIFCEKFEVLSLEQHARHIKQKPLALVIPEFSHTR
jgi:ubiquinone/menaquinone biosynthesis C-methylase UbiE